MASPVFRLMAVVLERRILPSSVVGLGLGVLESPSGNLSLVELI